MSEKFKKNKRALITGITGQRYIGLLLSANRWWLSCRTPVRKRL